MILFDPICSSLIQFIPFWSNLIKFEHVWASLNQFSPFWSNFIKFEQIWSSLNQSNPFWSNSIKFDQVWTAWLKIAQKCSKFSKSVEDDDDDEKLFLRPRAKLCSRSKMSSTLTTSLFVSMILEHVDLAFFHSFIFIWHRAIFKRPACNRITKYFWLHCIYE